MIDNTFTTFSFPVYYLSLNAHEDYKEWGIIKNNCSWKKNFWGVGKYFKHLEENDKKMSRQLGFLKNRSYEEKSIYESYVPHGAKKIRCLGCRFWYCLACFGNLA